MRVFLTGATGFIGSAILSELLSAGHDVVGLARSDEAANTLARLGVAVQRGDLSDLDSLATGARHADGVIHTAFIHDFSRYMENILVDRQAIEAMIAAMAGSNKPLIVTSGSAVLPQGRLGTEDDAADANGNPRGRTETVVLAAAEQGIRSVVVRLPPSVHGRGDHAFVPMLIDLARQKGVAAYVGDGFNRWPAVHRLDAARLFRLALERAPAGSRQHGVADQGVPMRLIAESIGEGLGIPALGLSTDEASAHFGWMAMFAGIDNPVSSATTQTKLGWTPREPGLLDDMRDNGYFD